MPWGINRNQYAEEHPGERSSPDISYEWPKVDKAAQTRPYRAIDNDADVSSSDDNRLILDTDRDELLEAVALVPPVEMTKAVAALGETSIPM